jgi:hypothetical protein
MKSIITVILLALCIGLLYGATSCVVLTPKDKGHNPKGWYKNSNNPHHPASTNPGKAKGHHKK